MSLIFNLSGRIQNEAPDVPVNIPDPKVELEKLKSLSFDEFIDKMINGAVDLVIHIAIAALVFYAGKFIIGKLTRFVSLVLLRRKVDNSLTTFILSFIKILLYFILIVTVIGILGIETSSFIAIFASAGVAIGMALSGTLQNFAGGVLILLLKPYRVGNYIEAQGYAGTVTEIQIFHTIINTPDNKSIIIPNGPLSTSSINNWSREQYRRVTWEIGISYGDNVSNARETILDLFKDDKRIVKQYVEKDRLKGKIVVHDPEKNYDLEKGKAALENFRPKRVPFFKRIFGFKRNANALRWKKLRSSRIPNFVEKINLEPTVYVNELGSSSVNLTVRAWVRTEDYWNVFFFYNEKFYEILPLKANVNFPFPQMDVHLKKEN